MIVMMGYHVNSKWPPQLSEQQQEERPQKNVYSMISNRGSQILNITHSCIKVVLEQDERKIRNNETFRQHATQE
jgi:hypothetical protein